MTLGTFISLCLADGARRDILRWTRGRHRQPLHDAAVAGAQRRSNKATPTNGTRKDPPPVKSAGFHCRRSKVRWLRRHRAVRLCDWGQQPLQLRRAPQSQPVSLAPQTWPAEFLQNSPLQQAVAAEQL